MISRLSENSATRGLIGTFTPINTQTNTTYTLVLEDRSKIVELNNINPITVTIPSDSTAPFYIGDTIELLQTGVGTVSVTTAGGVTLNGVSGQTLLTGQWDSMKLIKREANSWAIVASNMDSPIVTNSTSLHIVDNSDKNKIIEMTSSSANVVRVSNELTLSPGSQITIIQAGTGKTQITVSGTTLLATPGVYLRARYSSATLIKTTTADTWYLIGDLSAS